jgi:hypothetical protein
MPDPPTTPTEDAFLDDGDRRADVAELASFYRHLADAEFDGYCDLYAGLARAIAEDEHLLDDIAAMAPAAKIIPVLLFAAVHDRVLADPSSALAAIYRGETGDAFATFRAFVLDHREALAATVRTRSIQTNEVGRSVVLVSALTAVHRQWARPLAIIEVGPSAGLNLLLDRFSYHFARGPHDQSADRFSGGVRLGAPDGAVQLECEVRGPLAPPLDALAPPISSRIGIDLAPVDVLDAAACRWLEACIWPQVPRRAERLRAAIALARADPPELIRGDVFTDLPGLIERVPADVVPVVITTWVLAYFSKADRVRLGDLLADIGGDRDLAFVTAEYPSIAPGIERPDRAATDNSGQAATLVGVSTWRHGRRQARPVAWAHAHGRWLDWLDPLTAGPG